MKKLIRIYETIHIVAKHKKVYFDYYKKNKRKIYSFLKAHGFYKIKPCERFQWKLWYNTCYFTARKDNIKVFVKVTGKIMEDVFNNEIIVNNYIENNSKYLSERMPKINFHGSEDEFFFIATEYKKMELVDESDELEIAISKAISEFNRIGIIHNDFGRINISFCDGEYFFFDYGTSLCPDSKIVRFNKLANYKTSASEEALELITCPDYYYSDVIRVCSKYSDANKSNFIIGKEDIFYAKLGDNIYKYVLRQTIKGSSSYQLVRED